MFERLVSRARDIRHDSNGAVAIQMALSLTALLGAAGLATDLGLVYYKQRQMQTAADAAAFSAALDLVSPNTCANSTTYLTDVLAVAGKNGFVSGKNGVTVTPHCPPATAANAANNNAVQVVIQQTQPSLLSSLVDYAGGFNVSAQAVAGSKVPAVSTCILALSGSGVSLYGGDTIVAPSCIVASQTSVYVRCGTYISAQAVDFVSRYAWGSTGCPNIYPLPKQAPVTSIPDPLASQSGIVAANARAVAAGTLTGPTIPAITWPSMPSMATMPSGGVEYHFSWWGAPACRADVQRRPAPCRRPGR